ncbi:MAG TPA: PRC and DUF2382 domain-containing protein [Solirubrobacteraceae bacterium]|nr:PRC and DUF2382 domain-containing protein [Solirubrobacteraceae bacterium]
MATIGKDRILEFRGQDLRDRDGDKIGSIEEIYLDTQTGEPEWALVHTGLFGTKQTFVPLRDASEGDGGLSVPFEKSQVKDAPKVDPDGQLSQREESELYRHYGLEYSESESDTGLGESGGAGTGTLAGGTTTTGDTTALRDDDTARTSGETTVERTWAGDDDDARTRGDATTDTDSFGGAPPVGDDVSGPETDNAMTRSEEELAVGTREREAGRARLRKYVVTEEVQQTVPVKREEIRVEREPITDANIDDAMDGPELSEEEHEVVLHEEEPVAEKRVVPKERIRLDKDVETEERTVSESVAREEVEVDGDPDRSTTR